MVDFVPWSHCVPIQTHHHESRPMTYIDTWHRVFDESRLVVRGGPRVGPRVPRRRDARRRRATDRSGFDSLERETRWAEVSVDDGRVG